MQPTLPTPQELEQLLAKRLALSAEEYQSFLKPAYAFGDLWQFTGMDRAVDRLHTAIQNNEHIGIFADYDCDGIPGAVVLIDLFKKLNVMERIHMYIPDRHDEGYGVSIQGLTELETHGSTLVITIDVGITAIAEVAHAQSRGIDVIVTDHHTMLSDLPQAYAIVHPNIGTYHNSDACGAAVAFYLVSAFLERYGKQYDIPVGWEKWLLDLVGFATLSDMVPLGREGNGENRMLALYGIHVMKRTRRIGLRILLEKNGIALPNLIETDLTFTVAPRLNAASRMDTPMLAFELLSTDDAARARAIVEQLEMINTDRKTLVAQIAKSAHASIAHRAVVGLDAIVVIGNPEWRPAVLGLVANKLVETYNKSFFVWGQGGDGSIKGSCRMITSHHAGMLFQSLPEGTLLHAGGHKAAGGFSVSKEKVHFLETALNDALATVVVPEQTQSEHPKPIVLPLSSTTSRHLAVVRTFAPFGVGNTEPCFLFENITVQSVKMFGKSKEHIEINVRDTTGTATAFTFFADNTLIEKLSKGTIVSIIGTLEAGWRGGVRIRIKEIL